MALSKIDIENMITGEVNVANGGTGLSSGTSGQFLKFTGSTTLASAADNGKVGQVVQAYQRGEQTTTSTTFQDFTQLTGTITPTATNSKVLVQIEITSHIAAGYVQFIDFKRNISGGATTQIGTSTDGSATQGFVYNKSLSGDLAYRRSSITWLDSPSTTSQITYYPVMKSETNGQTAYIFNNGNLSTIQLTEILA